MQILHFYNPRNWFDVKSEWYKNHEIFTLWALYLFHNVKSLMHFNFPAQFHTDSMILHIFWGTNQLLEWFFKKKFCILIKIRKIHQKIKFLQQKKENWKNARNVFCTKTWFLSHFSLLKLMKNESNHDTFFWQKTFVLKVSYCQSTDLCSLIGNTQCGNSRIFLPFKSYEKSILVI